MIASRRIVPFTHQISKESIVSLIPIRHRFQEVIGLQGYLALEDPTLEQIRELQRQIDPARNFGACVNEYRRILGERIQGIGRIPYARDSGVTLLWCSYAVKEAPNGDRFSQTTVKGMISYELLIGASFTSAIVWDLIVDKPFREAGISRHIIDECHTRFRRAGITHVYPLYPDKRSLLLQKLFQGFGYTAKKSKPWLEYRL